MKPRSSFVLFLPAVMAAVASAQNAAPPPASAPSAAQQMQRGTTPGAHNDTELRELTPEEIYPNLNFYAVNPLYREGTRLG